MPMSEQKFSLGASRPLDMRPDDDQFAWWRFTIAFADVHQLFNMSYVTLLKPSLPGSTSSTFLSCPHTVGSCWKAFSGLKSALLNKLANSSHGRILPTLSSITAAAGHRGPQITQQAA
eukprot:CAMPEP_0117664992 /NCGR_PEP_ID=MMETSP0804-20121206/9550_1 /TAXON_ID=1074897 /ORGANISM="Tetraselmis astigmatica, Strain CCMP880" /LENGTH=117 /DNA_ID=CAMNT_0005472331 /DNA_START=98 /DNA_END=451 /DNA_ORIENTATION=-